MKGIDILCASQSATAIHLGINEGSSSSSSSSSSYIHLSSSSNTALIDRHSPIITDSIRTTKQLPPFSFSIPPITPKPHNNNRKSRKNTSKTKDENKKNSSTEINDQKRKICVTKKKGWSCTKPGDFITPPTSSSRYLLGETSFMDVLPDFDPVLKLVPASLSVESSDSKQPAASSSLDQVVVLRVSLHCRGCERKLRKHISGIEGVTSFNIDFAAKKVTVVGDVTPLGVLSSVSKVKSAQLWTPTITSSVPLVSSNTSELRSDGIQ